ncbi:MAG TPA: SCP2 sterol-binding domain-containing protein, partial [Kofleriaceae bacterium]
PKRGAEVVAKLRAAGGAAPAAAPAAAQAASQAAKIFAALDQRLAANPGLAQELGASLVLVVKDSGARHTISAGGSEPAATLTLNDADLAALASGQATPQQLYQQGKLRIDGDVSVGHRLGFLKGLI